MTTQRDGWETLCAILASVLAGIAGISYLAGGMTFERAVVFFLMAIFLMLR